MSRTVVIGLDGAHFELIEPWLEEGELPNIKKMMEEGIYSDMEACLPPVTSPNWKCYSTGKNPGELGIFWWENIDVENRRVFYPEERKGGHEEIWDTLSNKGYKVVVINTPLTYPPKEVNGIMICGGPDCQERGFTYPKDLEERLKNKYNYGVHLKKDMRTNEREAIREIYELIKSRFEVALDLFEGENPDFMQVTTFYLNTLQHFLWNGEETKKAWKIIDGYIGKFLEKDNTNVILMSDHGSNEIETVFNINTWLEGEGYLKYNWKFRLSRFLERLNLSREKIGKFLDTLGLRETIKKIVPQKVNETVPSQTGEIKKSGKSDKIDWEKSKAVASGQGPIYLLEDDKELKEGIKNKLFEIRNEKGNKVIREVYEKEEIYSGKYMDEAPDLIIDQMPNVHIPGGIGKENIFDFSEVWKAENKKYGLFVGIGNDLNEEELENLKIIDLKNQILDLFH